jgi:S-adenosylmethionine synthetase
MSKLLREHVFTSESVSEGHPDKVCDQVSDAILDACLAEDAESHVACETLVTANLLVNAGEITCRGWDKINPQASARAAVRDVGDTAPGLGFCDETFTYICALHRQSEDINQGVSRKKRADQGAGDQGMMFGYATNETPEMMPMPLVLSHLLLQHLAMLRKKKAIAWLRPDSKAQASVLYTNGKPVAITKVVISHQTGDVDIKVIRKELEAVARGVLDPTGLVCKNLEFFINPTGRFVHGGPQADSGVTGRKIIVDSYGGVGSHGGGAFSGKDPSKVDRSAAYYARYAAKNIVAAGLADKCEIQVAYAIGKAEPLSINVSTYGTAKVDEDRIAKILTNGKIFDFRPAFLIAELGLKKPKGWCYRDTSNYGHFGRDGFPWEKINRVDALRDAAGLGGKKK